MLDGLKVKQENLYEKFCISTKNFPTKIALVVDDQTFTYNELNQVVDKMIKDISITKEQNIAVLLDNSIKFVALLIAAAKVGTTLVPFDQNTPQNQKETLYKKTDIAYEYNQKGLVKFNNQRLSHTPTLNELPYIIVSTSGSTSEPKPIVLTQTIKLKRIEAAYKNYTLDQDDTILVSTPLHHSLAQRGVLLGLTLGATVVLLDRFTPKAYLEAIERNNVTFTFSVSNQLESIVEMLDAFDVGSIKRVVSSSYAIKPDIKKRLLQYFDIHECYGTSEIGCVTELSPKDIDKHLASVGRAMDGVDIKILQPDNNGIGEIIVRSPWRFQEYYNLPKTTAESFIDGYFKTGDLGKIEDGFLYYKGRKKEMIKTGGISVYPMDIEKAIKEIKGIDEVAVIGIEDSYFGEAIVAVYTGNAKISDIRKEIKRALLPYQQPLFYDKVKSLPKNSMGKLQKFKLKECYKELDLGKRLQGLL